MNFFVFFIQYMIRILKTKKVKILKPLPFLCLANRSINYLLCLGSSETLNLFLPFARRAFKTFLPFTDDILSLKPCLFFLFLFDG